MKKRFSKIALIVLALLAAQTLVQAQVRVRSSREEQEAQKSDFASKLWYGGNLGLGFSSFGNESLFQIGVAPMVGYKLFDAFSVGPRASIFYSHYRLRLGNEVETANPLTWSVGAFTRYKILRTIFAHAEYEFADTPVYSPGFNGDLEVLRRQRTNVYLGGGYNSGERFGYEIMALYNVNQPVNEVESPFVIRFGFTYNF